MSFGVMGAEFQPMGQAHVVANMVDYGMDIQQAIDAPRAFFIEEITEVERGISEETIAGLEARGHCHMAADRASSSIGRGAI